MTQCAHQNVTTRAVPIELYAPDGTPTYRIGGAMLQTCTACGASFYAPEEFLRQPTVPMPQPSLAPQYDVGC